MSEVAPWVLGSPSFDRASNSGGLLVYRGTDSEGLVFIFRSLNLVHHTLLQKKPARYYREWRSGEMGNQQI